MEKDKLLSNIFIEYVTAIRNNVLIERSNSDDKEFHFQNWVRDRLTNTGGRFTAPGGNSFPDFKLDHYDLGFEVKGLAFPGREASYDGNSQAPKPDFMWSTLSSD